MNCSRWTMWMGKLLADAAILGGAFVLAFLLRFEGDMPARFVDGMLIYLPIVLVAKLAILAWAGRFKTPWRYVNLWETVRIFNWLLVVSMGLLLWLQLRVWLPFEWSSQETLVLPVGVIILDLVLSFLGLVGIRSFTRLVSETNVKRNIEETKAGRVPTLLFGAGRAGAMVAKEILARPDSGIDLVGFIDDDDNLYGMDVEGLPVLGSSADLPRIAQRYHVRQVIISIADKQEKTLPRIARLCEDNGLKTKIIPPLHEIVEGKINLSQIREVSIEDLLRRDPVQLDLGEIEKLVRNQVVLVTGAGGSIGSELCRIIAGLNPATLVLVEQAENSLFTIHMALVEKFPNLHIVPCIADICDEARMDAIFAEW
ncbi:MAG: polysaccharide biosynthesis protein, partial [Planctomycetes bacterium]|nr:polysaccharide biosynthesis protein [Planctomycetota bacterium]